MTSGPRRAARSRSAAKSPADCVSRSARPRSSNSRSEVSPAAEATFRYQAPTGGAQRLDRRRQLAVAVATGLLRQLVAPGDEVRGRAAVQLRAHRVQAPWFGHADHDARSARVATRAEWER